MNRVKTPTNCPRKTKASCKMLLRIAGYVTALIAGALTVTPAWALPSCPVSPTMIKRCCVADRADHVYAMGGDLKAAGGCFRIAAPHVLFDMNGYVLNNTTTRGIGIHVLSTATNAAVVSSASKAGQILSFATGLKTDASGTLVFRVSAETNNQGMVFNGSGAVGYDVAAIDNVSTGIILTSAASGSYFFEPGAIQNGGNGIVLRRTASVTLRRLVADLNGNYGLWLKGASFNTVTQGDLEGNAIAGAYLGCHAFGPSPGACAIPPSDYNSFDGAGYSDHLTVGNCAFATQGNQTYGIAIDRGNAHNHVFSVETDSSSDCVSPGDTRYDGYDGNGAMCRGNKWLLNDLTTENHEAGPKSPFCMQ